MRCLLHHHPTAQYFWCLSKKLLTVTVIILYMEGKQLMHRLSV